MNAVQQLAFQLKALKIQFESEFIFHPERKWRLDFALPLDKIGIEVHGGVFSQGRHTRGAGFTNDREKMNEALILGWRVIEVTAEHIKSGQALRWIERALGR
jgi:hypothetical protein